MIPVNEPMKRRAFLARTAGAAGAWAAASALSGYAQDAPSSRPNLMFVFSDQQSHDMLGCYGNEQIVTPNIDLLAAEGVRFNHCVSSCPVCSPYRGMLLSGQHALHNGVISNDAQLLTDNGVGFGEALKQAGYRTGYVGKWHLYGGDRDRGVPPGAHRHGFDTFLSNNCHLDYRPGHCFYFNDEGEKVFFDKWEPDAQTDQAIDFIDMHRDEPFALFLSWHPPHDHLGGRQYITQPEWMDVYDRNEIRLRPNVIDTPQVRQWYHGYMAMCTGLDAAFGRLMDTLRARGLDDNTIVVYTSDHGDHLNSNRRPWPKGFPEDASCRVPFIIRWPARLAGGATSDLLIGTLDLMPTLLRLMGVTPPRVCQGRDLAEDLLAGREDTVDSVPLFMLPLNWRGIYTHDHTYAVDTFAEQHDLSFNVLYDRRRDPHQIDNVYYAPQRRDLRAHLHRKTLEWLDLFGDRFWTQQEIWPALGFETGKLSGPGVDSVAPDRPVDVMRASGQAGRYDDPLPTPEQDRERAERMRRRQARWDLNQRRLAAEDDPHATGLEVLGFPDNIIDGELFGLTAGHSEVLNVVDGVLEAHVKAGHPHPRPILWRNLDFDTRRFARAKVRLRATAGRDPRRLDCRLVIRAEGWNVNGDVEVPVVCDGSWHVYELDLTTSEAWREWTPRGRFGFSFPADLSEDGADITFELDFIRLEVERSARGELETP